VYYPTKANQQTKLTIWNRGASVAPTHSPTRCCSVALARQLFVRCSVRRSVRPLVGCVRQTRESTGRPELSGSESYGKMPSWKTRSKERERDREPVRGVEKAERKRELKLKVKLNWGGPSVAWGVEGIRIGWCIGLKAPGVPSGGL